MKNLILYQCFIHIQVGFIELNQCTAVVQSSPHFEVPTSFRLVLIFNQPRWGSKNCNTSSNGIFQIKCSVCLPPKCKRLVMFTFFFVSSDEPELLMFCPSWLCHVLSQSNSATCAAHLSICGRIPHQIWHQGKSNGSPSFLHRFLSTICQ